MERYNLFKKQSDSNATEVGGILVWDEMDSTYIVSSIPLEGSLQHKYFVETETNPKEPLEPSSLEEIHIGPAKDVAPYFYRLKK